MRQRLIACGIRPISNVVDVTNYVLLEYGQPLHAFDYGWLAGGTIIVRRASAKEPITTLDGVSRALTQETLVIADARRAVAVAGVMGGTGSEVTERTRAVLLESALFHPITVRRTSRALGLASESSYRFERGVDPEGVEAASARAAQLIVELAGGAVTAVEDVGEKPRAQTSLRLETDRLNRWLGTRLTPVSVRTTLVRLGCRVAASSEGAALQVHVPTFRRDLTHPVDLYDELARLTGYDHIPLTWPSAPLTVVGAEGGSAFAARESLRALCASLGLAEALTWSLASESDLARCGFSPAQALKLANPLSQDHAYLRPSLLIGLLGTVRHNLSQGASGVRVFELGAVADRQGGEQQRLGLALSGVWIQDWYGKEPCDFFRLKGLLEALGSRLAVAAPVLQPAAASWAEPHEITEVLFSGRRLGMAGQVSRRLLEALDIAHPVWFAELSVDALLGLRRAGGAVTAPTAFPPVKRDLSVLVKDSVAFASIAGAIRETTGSLAARVDLIDRYTGKQVPAGTHSLTFSVEYRTAERTLTAAEVDEVHRRLGRALADRFGAMLR